MKIISRVVKLLFIVYAIIVSTFIFSIPKKMHLYTALITNNLLSPNEITSLDVPDGLEWKEESMATATWNKVENANYYYVFVSVYSSDENFIGESVTGTSDTSIDLQQELFLIVSGVVDHRAFGRTLQNQ